MTKPTSRTAMITGANARPGKEVARQFALRGDTAMVYLACRNELPSASRQHPRSRRDDQAGPHRASDQVLRRRARSA